MVGASTGLDIVFGNFQNSNGVAFRRSTLIEIKSMDDVGIFSIQFRFFRVADFTEHLVRHVLHGVQVSPRQSVIVRDVQTTAIRAKVRAGLENMGS